MDQQSCHFCSKKPLYTCPQCNVQYCSSDCYKSPSHQACSEKFYKNLVEENLKATNSGEESKKKMVEILQRVHDNENIEGTGVDEDILDSDDDEDLSKRLKNVNLDDSDTVWANLTESEKKEFLEMIKSGKTEDLIPPWEPWWDSKSLIKDVTNPESKVVAPFMESCPPILSCPPLSQIMKNAPADCVPFNILNVLTSYIWTVRLFNGDHQESCVDATEAILTLSPVLSAEANFSSGEIAVKAPMIEAQNHSYLAENQEFHDTVKKDLRIILEGPSSDFKNYFVMSSLSDLHSLFTSCKKSLKPKKEKSHTGLFSSSILNFNQEIIKKHTNVESVGKCIKKIKFYLSYVQEYYYRFVLDIP
ncbi:UNVERIFIED_CONTAM: hypothetical protein RMT77_018396 [Armadillidium vulgare]